MKKHIEKAKANHKELARYLLWGVATGALIGSLILSDVIGFIPCTLCWWQRILMYPIAFVATVGIIRKDISFGYYVLPFAVIGICVSFYHSLLQWGIIRETVLDCSLTGAVSCTDATINWLGFITIPFMAFVSFVTIAILAWLSLPRTDRNA